MIDVQNDFCPGGNLAVDKGDEIIPVINRLTQYFDHVILTQDWHPADHSSFAGNHEGKSAYDTIQMQYGEQVLWPDHCIQATHGASFHPDLNTASGQMIIRKGFRKEIDSYSAFFENDHDTPTGLHSFLNGFGVEELFICGLATDFCVKWSALDARKLGYDATLVTDAIQGIDIDGSVEQSLIEMRDAGVHFQNSENILTGIQGE